MKYEKFIILSKEDLRWDFENNPTPYLEFSQPTRSWKTSIKVDPFPCVTHDLKLLKEKVKTIESAFPIGNILQWVIVPFEVDGRVNAWASSSEIYASNDKKIEKIRKKHKLSSYIAMSGKRTIVHPAMTSYLVAHEYGHQVDYWITKLMEDEAEVNDNSIFRRKYAEFRKAKLGTGYGGGKWVNNIMEIIADDFRIVVGGTDVDFFVHDSVKHPLADMEVSDYWAELFEKYKFKK